MTANDIYTVLGTTGTSGCSGNAHVASTALINTPTGIAVDGSGNLYVADSANNRILELPPTSGTYWGISMTGKSEYTVAGHSTCTSGISGTARSQPAPAWTPPTESVWTLPVTC